jgi:hypothetical protein
MYSQVLFHPLQISPIKGNTVDLSPGHQCPGSKFKQAKASYWLILGHFSVLTP